MFLSVLEKLFGPDDMEKPIPQLSEDCLIFDGTTLWPCVVSNVYPEKYTYDAENLETGITYENAHFCRYRPISH